MWAQNVVWVFARTPSIPLLCLASMGVFRVREVAVWAQSVVWAFARTPSIPLLALKSPFHRQ